MIVAESLDELRMARKSLQEPVGLVPTMGYLHEGHLSLARAAKRDCASVVASIYVNPTQFGPQEDFSKYPRDLQRDLDMLQAKKIDLVWTPGDQSMYPDGYQTWVMVEQVSKPLEGSIRQGHFRGVTTVVAKLFNAVQPQKAYFGQKDAQQAAIIRRMTRDLDFPIEIVICPIVREADGLAMSSRNSYLSETERRAATVLFRALEAAEARWRAGDRRGSSLAKVMEEMISAEHLARIDYAVTADPVTFCPVETATGSVRLLLAVFIGQTRLVDNRLLVP